MKKLILIAFAALCCVTMTACNDDDDHGGNSNPPPIATGPSPQECERNRLEYPCVIPPTACTEPNCPTPVPTPTEPSSR